MPEPDWERDLKDWTAVWVGSSERAQEAALRSLKPHLDAAYHRGLVAGRSQTGYGKGSVPLTGRHLEVARLAAAGLTNKEIGQRLFLSENTVKTHLRAAFRATGARSRGHLASLLAVSGYVTSANVPNPKESGA
jgi:DNA-binding CsgD family transcriptional regulator